MNILHQVKHIKKRELYGNVFKIQPIYAFWAGINLNYVRTRFYSQISYKQWCELLVFHTFFSSIQNKIYFLVLFYN